MNSLFGILSTIFSFKFAKYLNKYPLFKEISPILIAGIVLIFILKIFNIDYSVYKQGASYITFLLIPATIALGYPLYKNSNMLVKNKRIIYVSFLLATIIAILSTYIIAYKGHAHTQIIVSMLPKSITAPMAIEISKQLGGIPELTACVVVLTGVFGAIFGHKILKLVKVKNNIAIGVAIGSASHVVGTSKCIEKGNQKQIVMSTLAIVIVGILTVILAPLIWNILKYVN